MLKGHPKGLLVAFFANMGERFGYYTMLAIFVLYLQANFGFSTSQAGDYYGGFLFGIYFLPILGGIIADRWLGYGKTIILGTIIMFAGYMMLASPGFFDFTGTAIIIASLFVISLGTGLFKGNLQALVGKLYDDPQFAPNRDNAFNIFYMGINIGAFFAPTAATGVVNWVLGGKGFSYESSAPHLANLQKSAHPFLDKMTTTLSSNFDGVVTYTGKLQGFMSEMGFDGSLTDFITTYPKTLSTGYSSGFAIAAMSMIVSLIIFTVFRKHYKHADVPEKQKEAAAAAAGTKSEAVKMTKEEEKKRLVALGLVFITVAFFWMAFHQNGFTLTIFARDYTVSEVSKLTYIFFDLRAFLPLLAAVGGLIFLLRPKSSSKARTIGGIFAIVGAALGYWAYSTFDANPTIEPQLFQHFNPIFIVFLTPVIVGFFTWLRKNGKEPSSPRKIGMGMFLTALGFAVMLYGAFKLQSMTGLNPYWLIGTYFTLTIAELFLSPIGISFVSKVAPPRFVGLAQGGWLGATAIGNLLAGLVGKLWDIVELWQFFALLVALTVLSGIFIFSIMRILENATKSSN
ncbi:MAG: peptide MFS transporter [Bacteroidales bacterium]|nr:peptide MFS transporter [Bacteroidales bacterium]